MLTKMQESRCDQYVKRHDVIEHYETKGGLLAIKFNRSSEKYPIGVQFFGRRGGDKGFRLYRPDGTMAYEEAP